MNEMWTQLTVVEVAKRSNQLTNSPRARVPFMSKFQTQLMSPSGALHRTRDLFTTRRLDRDRANESFRVYVTQGTLVFQKLSCLLFHFRQIKLYTNSSLQGALG